MRRTRIVLAALLVSCAGLEPLEPGVCGNGVIDVELGEACDKFPVKVGSECAAPGTPNECKYVCDNVGCPAGWSCGPDLACRFASGEFRNHPATPLRFPNERFFIDDADADGEPDLIGWLGGQVTVLFGERGGSFSSRAEVSLDRATGDPAFVLSPEDRRLTVLVPTESGVALFHLAQDRRFDPILPGLEFSAPAGAPIVARSAGEDTLYFWPVGGDVAVSAGPLPMRTMFPGRAIGALHTASNGVEVAVAFEGEEQVTVLSTSLDARELDTPPAIDAGGVVFVGDELWVSTSSGVAVAGPGDTRATVRALLDPFRNDFPLAAAELDGDGAPELITPSCIHYSGSNPRCGAARIEAVTADFNGDGARDVAALESSRMFIETVIDGISGRIDLLDEGRSLAPGDFDGDGYDDLAWIESNDRDGTTRVYVAFGAAGGLDVRGTRQISKPGLSSIAAQITEDAPADLALTWDDGARQRFFLARGSTRRALTAPVATRPPRAIVTGHFIDEAELEAAVLTDTGVHVVLSFAGAASEPTAALFAEETLPQPIHATVADRSVLVVSGARLVRYQLASSGSALSLTKTETTLRDVGEVHNVRYADVDQDQVSDLIVEHEKISLFFGTGEGFDGESPAVADGYAATSLNADEDVQHELLVLFHDGVYRAQLNDAKGLETTPSWVNLPGFGDGSIAGKDLDGDGLADFAFSDHELVHLRLLVPQGEKSE